MHGRALAMLIALACGSARGAHAGGADLLGASDGWRDLPQKMRGGLAVPQEDRIRVRIIDPGQGPPTADTAIVWLRLTARLLDGTAIGSTAAVDRSGAAAQPFEMARLPPGLREAVRQMPPGAVWQIVVPPTLGPRRAATSLLRHRALVFDVQVQGPAAAAGGTTALYGSSVSSDTVQSSASGESKASSVAAATAARLAGPTDIR